MQCPLVANTNLRWSIDDIGRSILVLNCHKGSIAKLKNFSYVKISLQRNDVKKKQGFFVLVIKISHQCNEVLEKSTLLITQFNLFF